MATTLPRTMCMEAAEVMARGPLVHVERQDVRRAIHRCLGTLSPREASVIRRRFGLEDGHEATFGELATEDGVTRGRIHQLQKRALQKIRARAVVHGLTEFVPDDGRAPRVPPTCARCRRRPRFKAPSRWLPIHDERLITMGWALGPTPLCDACQSELRKRAEAQAAFELGPNIHLLCGGVVVEYSWPFVQCRKCFVVWNATWLTDEVHHTGAVAARSQQ
jgi:hypothetical protein